MLPEPKLPIAVQVLNVTCNLDRLLLQETDAADHRLRHSGSRRLQQKPVRRHFELGVRISRQHVRHDIPDTLGQGVGGLLGCADLFEQGGPAQMHLPLKSRQPVSEQCIQIQARLLAER